MIQDCLHLDSEQARCLGRLEIGWTVLKLRGRSFFPFLVKLPLVKMKKGSVTDHDIKQRAVKFSMDKNELLTHSSSFSSVVSPQEGNSKPEITQDSHIPVVPVKAKIGKINGKNRCTIQLTTQERGFLRDVWQHPTSSITQRYQRLSPSRRSGNKLQNSLLFFDFIISSSISLPKGRIKILSLKKKGRKELGIKDDESDRHGGPEHQYWAKRIADHLRESGHKVEEEFPIGGGKSIDLLATRNGHRLAFEIETGKSNAASNIRKCLTAGLDKIFVIPTSTRAKDTLTSTLAKNPKVRLLMASEIINTFGLSSSSRKIPESHPRGRC